MDHIQASRVAATVINPLRDLDPQVPWKASARNGGSMATTAMPLQHDDTSEPYKCRIDVVDGQSRILGRIPSRIPSCIRNTKNTLVRCAESDAGRDADGNTDMKASFVDHIYGMHQLVGSHAAHGAREEAVEHSAKAQPARLDLC